MQLPADIPPPSPPPAIPLGNLVDEALPVTPQQRAADFRKTFFWHEKPLTCSVAGEFYYRDLRTHQNAPMLHSYQTMGDFTPEAARVLYCASLTAKEIATLQRLSPEKQIERFMAWIEANIAFHEVLDAAELAKEINDTVDRALTKPLETEEGGLDGAGN